MIDAGADRRGLSASVAIIEEMRQGGAKVATDTDY